MVAESVKAKLFIKVMHAQIRHCRLVAMHPDSGLPMVGHDRCPPPMQSAIAARYSV